MLTVTVYLPVHRIKARLKSKLLKKDNSFSRASHLSSADGMFF
jgi:hypothetical protein